MRLVDTLTPKEVKASQANYNILYDTDTEILNYCNTKASVTKLDLFQKCKILFNIK